MGYAVVDEVQIWFLVSIMRLEVKLCPKILMPQRKYKTGTREEKILEKPWVKNLGVQMSGRNKSKDALVQN